MKKVGEIETVRGSDGLSRKVRFIVYKDDNGDGMIMVIDFSGDVTIAFNANELEAIRGLLSA